MNNVSKDGKAVFAIVLIVAVCFIVAGVFNGSAKDVLGKAINICTECVGLG
ncbi:MAG: thioredoxin [Blautia sp.]|nr:thioredoxin [Blautia sp.]